jgi:hypothetical protein
MLRIPIMVTLGRPNPSIRECQLNELILAHKELRRSPRAALIRYWISGPHHCDKGIGKKLGVNAIAIKQVIAGVLAKISMLARRCSFHRTYRYGSSGCLTGIGWVMGACSLDVHW